MDTIINELTQGMELAMQLKSILSSESYSETKHVLIQQIISSYDRAMSLVNRVDSGGQTLLLAPPMPGQPESSVSVDESPRSQDVSQPFDDQQEDKVASKKRKAMPTWRHQIRISTENGLEGNTDDGYSWRKYGQKDILGSKFPRSYYRCTYRYVHHCMARKQVQRTNEDPTVFEITYKGQHTCNPTATPPVALPQSPEKPETKQNNHQLPLPPKSEEMLRVSPSFSFPSPIENYQQSHFLNETDYGALEGYSPSFISPAASGTNYFIEGGSYFQQHDESNLLGITATSSMNSPLGFPADPQDLSQSFPFNNSGYFI
ncbi:hypothetical protein L1987_56200 [Smallanthus sonchifolius]|uniref:Uncharacterized protein n=1 Tax=Smallanthus sonchifolius TaxID=185202 RepID=A0ACB9ECH1_9ASTR|nr:hypothetical protein L1987_56200 [Smallanthus sonchifolius]